MARSSAVTHNAKGGRRSDWDQGLEHGRPKVLNLLAMSTMQNGMIAGFTAGERDYIRRELDRFFSTLPSVAEGFQLKTWRGGPEAGKPKVPLTAKGLMERGLLRLETTGRLPRLFFTGAGIDAVRTMMADRRLADPEKFAHIRQELGIDAGPEIDGEPATQSATE